MTETKFTPAPWEAIDDEDGYINTVIDTVSHCAVACIEPNSDIPEEQMANCYLIACAPEMYEMLRAVLLVGIDDARYVYQWQIEQLLKKARGEK